MEALGAGSAGMYATILREWFQSVTLEEEKPEEVSMSLGALDSALREQAVPSLTSPSLSRDLT